MKKYFPYFYLATLAIIHIALNYKYNTLNVAPIPWDQANHTRLALLIKNCLASGEGQCLTISYYYPIFAHAVVAMLFMIFGNSMFLAQFSGTLFFILLLIGIFLYIKELTKNTKASILTTITFSLFPLIYHSSRFFWLEIPLLMNTIFSLYFLHKSDNFKKPLATILGFLFIGFAVMTKWYAILYIFIPYLLTLIEAVKRKEKLSLIIRNLCFGILTLLAIVLPWYISNYKALLENALYYAQADASQPQEIFSKESLLWYVVSAIQNQLGFIPAIIAIISSVYFIQSKKVSKTLKTYIFLQLAFVYIAFTLLGNKDMRFTLIILPYFSYIISTFLINSNKLIKVILGGALYSYFIFSLINFTFGWPLDKEYKIAVNLPIIGWTNIINLTNYPVERPNRNPYPLDEIVTDIDALSDEKPKSVLIVFDYPHLNSTNIITQQLLLQESTQEKTHVESVFLPEGLKDSEDVRTYVNSFDYALVTKYETAIGYFRFKDSLDKIQKLLLEGNYETIKTYTIPLADIEDYLNLYYDPMTSDTRRSSCKNTGNCAELILYKIRE